MDSRTTTPAAPDPLAAMLQNAHIDKAEKSEFTNSARDTLKLTVNNYNFTKEGENLVLECTDVIDCLRNAVQPFLAEVRKNDQSRSKTTGEDGSDPVPQPITTDHTAEGGPVKIIDLVPSSPSSLPVASVADRYTRSMLKCFAGYPLYEPQPFSELSREYLRQGVNVGDVGFVRGNGVFDFLFNICPSNSSSINPPNLSDGFSLETADHSITRANLLKTCLLQTPITRTKSGEYICEGPEGAILELPEGAIQDEVTNIRPFAKLAARHGVRWYEYTMTRGREISNGSLYLITSFTKCAQWGIAVFDRPCAPGQGLRFDKKRSLPFGKSTSKYHWKGSHTFPTKISNVNQEDAPNQCVFLRGYKIMIRQDIFDSLYHDQHGSDPEIPSLSSQARSINLTRDRATRIRGGGGSDPMSKRLTDGGLLSWTKTSSMTQSDKVFLHPNFSPSLVHPSDLINVALLSQNPDAEVALTHDDVWCDLLRDNFPKLNYATLLNIARSYTNIVDEYDCVTLEKFPDSSGVSDESNCPFQGTEVPALQEPLTTPDDDYAPLFAISVTLPRELVEQILILLDNESVLTCRLVNKEFNAIIQSSTLLQYFLACKAAGVIDNPRSPLSYAERLEALLKWEDAWRKLEPVFEMTIDVSHQRSSPISSSTGGAYFANDNNLKDLNYFHLPSSPHDDPRWISIPGPGPGEGWPGFLIFFETAVNEHDLIANIISSDIGNQADTQRHSLDLFLLKFSTGEYHPLARHPRIHVQRSPEARPVANSRIVGDNLALVVHSKDGSFTDKLFIFDWKTGHRRLQHEAVEDAYFTLEFISPELLLVPNLILSHFEIWHLHPSHPDALPPVQILSLQLPAVSPEYSLSSFGCRAEPKLFLHSAPHFSPRPFFSSPKDSVVVVRVRMSSNAPFQRVSYNLIMRRRSLLDTIQKWTSPLLEQRDRPTLLTNEVTVHKIPDPQDGAVRLDAQSQLVSIMPDPTSSSRTHGSPTYPTSTDSGPSTMSLGLSTNSSTSRCTFLQVPWAKWGPPISRWFQVNEIQGRFLNISNGQRYALSDPSPLDRRRLTISVADFNPHNFRRNAEMMTQFRSGKGEDHSSDGSNEGEKKDEEEEEKEEEEEFEILDHQGVFSEEVYMGLKCVVYRVPGEHDFDAVWMDEQRLLGVKLDREGWHQSVKVLYIG